jgi:hypothetical protein
MQKGKAGSYVWAQAFPAAKTTAAVKIVKAKVRIGSFSKSAQHQCTAGNIVSSRNRFMRAHPAFNRVQDQFG